MNSLDDLNAMGKSDFVAALGDVCEHAPWVSEEAFLKRPFPTLASLYETITIILRDTDSSARLAFIKEHPDLAGKAARAKTITEDSIAEQGSAGLDQLTEADYARFHRLNDAYRARFGIPFILCVRRHTKDSILRQFERRLTNKTDTEHKTALEEIFRIVALRLDARISADDRLNVHGRLSTHVLDTQNGRPAAGMGIELWEASDSPRLLVRTETNADGRTDQPLIAGRPVPVGTYELRFFAGDYFARAGVPLADPPFLDMIPVRFSTSEPEGHYHVPLLTTPWTYSTYRGS